ncbi:MAG TPA: dienelactone hydrolase family protein [Ktedonobacterales bacterium]|jgi:carboxymethylenebutenolidase
MSTAAPIHDQTISFPFGKTTRSAYDARPEGTGPFPGIVMIHEIFGLNENIKDIARRFAREGYAALAVDLFAGRNRALCMSRVMYAMLVTPLKHSGLNELSAALDHLGEQPEVDSERVGAIGFCMGGGFAIAWACTDARLKAIAPFYGSNPRPLKAVERACPVVGSYPEKDYTAKAGQKLDAALAQYNIPRDIKIYPGAQHSFFNDQGTHHDAAASADAWQRVLSFFGERISSPAARPKSAEA